MRPVSSPRLASHERPSHPTRPAPLRFVALYGNEISDPVMQFIDTMLANSSLRPKTLRVGEMTAGQVVEKVAAGMGREGHCLLGIHGYNGRDDDDPDKPVHQLQLSEQHPPLPTQTLIRMVVDRLGIAPQPAERPDRSLPFIYLLSCDAGALRHQIVPGSDLWKRANLLIFSGTRRSSLESSGNSLAGAFAYVEHCQQGRQRVDPMKLLYFAGLRRGDCVTLAGGTLQQPLVWHAPKSEGDQNRIDNLSGSPEDIERFMQAVASLQRDDYQLLPSASLAEVLYNRIARDDAQRLDDLLDAHPELANMPSTLGVPPLTFAISAHAHRCVATLINAGADLDARTVDGKTALMACVCQPGASNSIDMIETLLFHGADPSLQDNQGNTALMFVSAKGENGIARLLLERGAQPDLQSRDGKSALMWAAGYGHTDVLQTLLRHGADTGLQNQWGETALIMASIRRRGNAMQALLDCGADPDVQDDNGVTALMHAVDKVDMTGLQLLLKHKARMDLFAANGSSCLTLATFGLRHDLLRALLAAGADASAGLDHALVEQARARGNAGAARLLEEALASSEAGTEH